MKRMAVGDNDILTLMTTDSEAGFRMLMQRYGEQTYWHIRRLVVSHADAQDALQETFVRVFRSIGQLSADRQLRSWIYRIATNEALRIIGRRRSEVVSLESEATGVSLIASDSYTDFGDTVAVKLQKAILSLPPKQQLAFNMRYYDDMPFDEISSVTDSTPASIKASYHVAKEKIIIYMNENDQ